MAVLKIYKDVIDDVISAARELFLEDGVDEQVLQELKQTWEAKLIASKAVDTKTTIERQMAKNGSATSGTAGSDETTAGSTTEGTTKKGRSAQSASSTQKQVVGQVAPNNHVPQVTHVERDMVPIQITLPGPPGTNAPARVLTIQVPAPALQDNLLQKVLTGHVITSMMNLPPSIASSMLQQHVNAAFSQLAPTMINGINGTGSPKTVIQSDGADDDHKFKITVVTPSAVCSTSSGETSKMKKKQKRSSVRRTRCVAMFSQCDGAMDSSDDDEDASDDDDISDNDDDEKDDDEQEMDDGGPEEEPLNSEDDVTDEDPSDLFDTDNVVVCQYDKITRSRNKWKFHLKDGIMNLKGEDYVFQKANGDAEW